jgi:hypothetical protein
VEATVEVALRGLAASAAALGRASAAVLDRGSAPLFCRPL